MAWSVFKPRRATPVPWDDSFEEDVFGGHPDRSRFEEQMRHEGAEDCGEEPYCVLFHSPVEAGAPWSMSYDDGTELSSPCHPECREAGARRRGVTWKGMVDDETFWERVSTLCEPLVDQYDRETAPEQAKAEKLRAKAEKRNLPRAAAYETITIGVDRRHGGIILHLPVERPSGEEIVRFLLDSEPQRQRFGRKRTVRAIMKLAEQNGVPLSERDAEEIDVLLRYQVGNRLVEGSVELSRSEAGLPILLRLTDG